MKLINGFVLSNHANERREERHIKINWINLTLTQPDFKRRHKDGKVHYIRKVNEFGGRRLRVIVDPSKSPKIIVSLYFDSGLLKRL